MVNFLPDMCYSLSMTEYGDQFAEAIAEELQAQTASRIAETKRLAHKSDVSLAAYGAEGKDYYMNHDGEASA